MYFLMCFLVRVFGTITGKITTEYLTPGYYRPVTGVHQYVHFPGIRFSITFSWWRHLRPDVAVTILLT